MKKAPADGDRPDEDGGPSRDDSTEELIRRAQAGDRRALDRLFDRYRRILTSLAHNRLPAKARDLADTDDLVDSTLRRAYGRFATFESRGPKAFFAYLMATLQNLLRNHYRRGKSKPDVQPLTENIEDLGPSPLELAIGKETVHRYLRELEKLTDREFEAVTMRLEAGVSYAEIADLVPFPSAEAARVCVARAVRKIARGMKEDDAA